MNEETLTINGIEYIKKGKTTQQKDYLITEQCNVMAIVPMLRGTDVDEEIKIEGFDNPWKLYEGEVKLLIKSKKRKDEVVEIGNTKYSYKYIKQAERTAKAFFGSEDIEYFVWTENNEPLDQKPLIIKFGSMVFLLAPRVENE